MDEKVEFDIISDLHESIIGQILSLLPTEEAVQTCVLSKSWKYNWTAINAVRVNFHHWDYKSMTFIENLFRSIGDSRLGRFHYVSVFDESYGGEFKHILTILRRNLEELELNIRATIELSPSYPLSRLKILDLHSVKIVSDESSRFVLCCPCLRSLTFLSCDWLDFARITIDSPVLDTLDIEDCYYKNETSNGIESGYCVFNVLAPHLDKFIYAGAFYEEFHLSSPSSVSQAKINITTWRGTNPGRYDSGFELVARFSNLKHFSCSDCFECYIRQRVERM